MNVKIVLFWVAFLALLLFIVYSSWAASAAPWVTTREVVESAMAGEGPVPA